MHGSENRLGLIDSQEAEKEVSPRPRCHFRIDCARILNQTPAMGEKEEPGNKGLDGWVQRESTATKLISIKVILIACDIQAKP